MDKPIRILLIDDSADLGFLVRVSLKPYEVAHVFSAEEAWQSLDNEKFDLILIDVSLPDGDGFQICSELSQHAGAGQIPKILLTAKNEPEDKVFGFNCGADDYITKPFVPSELRARVDVRLRDRAVSAVSVWGPFEFDGNFQKCRISLESGQIDLQLTPTEYRLLLCLAKAGGLPVSREELVQQLWKSHGANIEARGIDAHIAHLRKKLREASDSIVSIYGKGYAFDANFAAKNLRAA